MYFSFPVLPSICFQPGDRSIQCLQKRRSPAWPPFPSRYPHSEPVGPKPSSIKQRDSLLPITASIVKYFYVILAFSQKMSRQFYDLLRTPPPDTHYQPLKTWVLKHYSMTGYQTFESIMGLLFSPDECPSNLMNKMLSIMPDGYTPDFIFKNLFLRRLPHDIRVILLKSMTRTHKK